MEFPGGLSLKNIIQLSSLLFFAILFIQSGLDKVTDWAGNFGWINEHFSKSVMKDHVGLMLGILTFLECACGFFCLVGIAQMVLKHENACAIIALLLCNVTLIALFFGQRLAKDYAGAGALVPYYIANLFSLFLFV